MKDLCEQGFSSMLYVKNKYTSQMKDLDNRLRLKLTNIDFAKLCSSNLSLRTKNVYLFFFKNTLRNLFRFFKLKID